LDPTSATLKDSGVRPVLLDTGVIVALLDRSEGFHERCASAIGKLSRPLVTCEAVIAESCYLLRELPGAAEAVVENVNSGVFVIRFQLAQSAAAVHRTLRKYRDAEIDFADACLIRLAEEVASGEILTLDRDFRVYRWGRNQPFESLIALD
jgi:predicted nucleic acid-binding protein